MLNPRSSTTDKNQIEDNVESLCGHCKKLVNNDSPAMECEIYNMWYHIKSQGIKKLNMSTSKEVKKQVT